MQDRIRIYELARQMGLTNQMLIDTLRELGFDVKSHSSTVDKNAFPLLVQALNKKKQGDTAGAPKAPAAAKSAKTPPPPPPPPPVVKPRVLNRYRPTPPPGSVPETPPPQEAPPAAPEVAEKPAAPAAPTPEPVTDMAPPAQAKAETPAAPESAVQADAVKAAAPEEVDEKTSINNSGKAENQKPAEKEPESKSQETFDATPTDDKDEPGKRLKGGLSSVKPSAPSVPIRIAAPSFRATPPRPPKNHRPPGGHHGQKREEKSRPAAATIDVPKVITITGPLTVKDLAEKMAVSETEIIKRLFMKGVMRTVNQMVEPELARDLAAEMNYEVTSQEEMAAAAAAQVQEEQDARLMAILEDDQTALVTRPPVVTIMGHVDHGKTSLLDAIRQTKFLLTDKEAGGITQHIGAYHVEIPHEEGIRQIVFLDTPGHEAFTAMRARGAKVTDLAILVVAADDGVMPQTIEAIDHAKAANVPIIVAVNKIDKQDADPERVLTQLMEHGVLADKFGGDTVTVPVSAKKRTGLDDLLEMILLVADMQDLKANPERAATGYVIEAELNRQKGAVATVLVQNGTLREGDFMVAGSAMGRVRKLLDDHGNEVKAAGPSMPVEVLGLDISPAAGERFEVAESQQAAKMMVEERKSQEADRRVHRVTLESLHDMVESGETQELDIIIKADMQGSAEAIADQVRKLASKEVGVRVLRTAVGGISENDVNLAASANAIIIGFNVSPDTNAERAAEVAGVSIREYNIIYQIIDDIELAMQGLLQPIKQEVEIGKAEVRALFKVGKGMVIAGCMVIEGKVQRNSVARIERAGEVVYEGKIDTLKRFKDDAKEVAQGFECGMSFEKFSDIKEGDIIRAFTIQEVKRELTR